MQCLMAIVGPMANCLPTDLITQRLSYLTSSAKHVQHMQSRMKVLEGHRAHNQNKMERHNASSREVPSPLEEWLKNIEDVQGKIANFPSNNDLGCLNVVEKYRAGEKAVELTKDIENLITEISKGIIIWSDAIIPPGRVDSNHQPSTSTSGGNTQTGFKSRDKIFNDALKFLKDDDKTRVIALCGMGGVGKTTLMNQLKEAAKDKKMFNYIAEVVIGKTPNLLSIQEAIAARIREPLTGTDVKLMAEELSKSFEAHSKNKEKILVILDDVWEKIKLEDIGLAPFPKGVKLLLTSRDVQVCRQIAVDVDVVLGEVEVDVLKEDEARDFFCRIAGISAEHDRDLYQKGCEIVKKCGYLPLAIKLIAATLIRKTDMGVWDHTLSRLKENMIKEIEESVPQIIGISYDMLKRGKDRAIFLLCGLFPEDSNIPIEDLTRYAWGLKLLNNVDTMKEARDSTKTSVSNLKNAYLLMDGDSRHSDCVKLHDLVLAFVVGTVSKGGKDGCGIIHHDDFSKSSEDFNKSQSCKQISITCKGMSKFPSEFKFPNLSLLKLMHGNESLRFRPDFYERMKKLQVIAFKKLENPVVPTTTIQCSTNLRTLCLEKCSLMFDLTCIGDLLNLEVLSFANSGITILPSTFGNLEKLRLLDVTGCYNLVIEDGVLKNMVNLEELYMKVYNEKACCFTDNNCNELAERSEHLSALEFEFIGNNAHLKNMSFEKLDRFKLSVGCSFTQVGRLARYQGETHSYENSLKLVTNREELLTSKINELFEKTDALYLQVNDMNTLEDIDPHPRNSSFDSLRFLVVSGCEKLKYLFTVNVAKSVSKLEYLDISRCPVMEAVIHAKDDESDIIQFSKLKYLRLAKLPDLSSFCDKVNVIELPCLLELQLERLRSLTSIYPSSASSSMPSNISGVPSFFHEEGATPKLEKLFVSDMENLKEIWSPQFSVSNLCLLRELTVEGCGSIEVLFSMDFGEIEQLSSSLRSIEVDRCECLVKLFSCNPFPFLNNLQEFKVRRCGSIQVVFNIDSGRAAKIEEPVCSCSLRSIVVEECDSLVNLFPVNPMPLFNNLEELEVKRCPSIEVLFNIEVLKVCVTDKGSSSRLRSIRLCILRKLREVWRIKDGGNSLIHGFEAVERIDIIECERFENIITPATTIFDMRALKQVELSDFGRNIVRNDEMVESKQDHEVDVVCIPGKEISDDIHKVAFSSHLLHNFHHLHKLVMWDYKGVEVVFEITSPSSRESPHNTQQPLILPYLEELSLYELERMSHVWKCDWNEFLILQKPQSQSSFHNLTTISMLDCHSIKYLFSPLMAKLLSNLKEVDIRHCNRIEEVVSNRDDEDASIYSHTTTNFFPHLDTLKLKKLRNFKCIGGGADCISANIHDQHKLSQASWYLCQYARKISIADCDALSSAIPGYAVGQMQKLQVLKIIDCKYMTEVFETQEINIKSGTDSGKLLPRLEYITMLKLPKLKILKIQGCHLLKHVFTFSTLESLTELEELEIKDCKAMEVIVKIDNGEHTTTSDVVLFPHLKSLSLIDLPNVVGFFLGRSEFMWPALKKLVIVECPQITVFTYGQSIAPKLKSISTSLGKHSVECGLNFHVTTTSHQARLPSYESTSSYHPTTMERLPWSYHNLIEVNMDYNSSVGHHRLFSSDKLLQLQKLETVHFGKWRYTEEIFDSETIAEIPNLRQVDLEFLRSLKYIWKSKQGTTLKFPNLTRLSIKECDSLEYVFTCSMVGSILQLQELHIDVCGRMKVIVKGEEECDDIGNVVVVFPCLKSLKLVGLKSLEGFCLGKEAFEFPSLDTLHIYRSVKNEGFHQG